MKAWIRFTVLLDAAAYKGVARLPIPHQPGDPGIITADDVRGIMKKQGIAEILPGDCVFLHTGHGQLWGNDVFMKMSPEQRLKAAAEFQSGEPGFGISACEFLASKDVALTGCDTNSCEAQPSGEKGTDYVVPCHTENQTRRGIWNIEDLDFKPLIDAHIHEFAFIFAPLKMVGATGSPANPMALY
jgi:kynurenine formamidase